MSGRLKIIKKLFKFLVFLVMLGCAAIMICAFNPDLTEQLVDKLGLADGGENFIEEQPSSDTYQMSGVNVLWLVGKDADMYEIPGKQPSKPPKEAGGRLGYQPVYEDAEQILQIEAENLSQIIAPGELGEGLIFDEELYPYYAMLQDEMRQLYRQIYANAQALTVNFTPVVSASVDQVKMVFEAVYNDHPELFWLEGGYSCKYLRTGSCVEIILQYNDTANYLEEAIHRFKASASNILAGVETIEGTYQRERYVHDVLIQLVTYDENAAMNQSAYSALVNGKSVCAGYARAFQYLMQQLGIPCYYCTGYTGEDHAWNIVDIDSAFYNVDVTWADGEKAIYDYFNKRDSEIAKTHVRTGLSVYLPACETKKAGVDVPDSYVADWINPDPVEPLRWQDDPSVDNTGGMTAEEKEQANLDKANLTKDQVCYTMDAYYAECARKLRIVGVGDQEFYVNIPDYLWNSVEKAYTSGDHLKAYASEVMKELKVENCVIQLQVQRRGGGYYRVYHNVLTY